MKTQKAEVGSQKSEVSHTPGPWGVIPNGGDVRPEAIFAPQAGGYIVATTWAIVPEAQRKANARLLAAAPELLAACQAMDSSFDQCGPWNDPYIKNGREAIRSAIAKATGSN